MTKSLLELDQKLIWHPYTQAKIAPLPTVISHAQGCYLYTADNKRLFDGISSWWTNIHGHCHPQIQKAINSQMEKLEHVIFANFTHQPAVDLADRLINLAPLGLKRVFYSDNGSTAVEVALKMAYQYWQHQDQCRPFFIALENSYHGDTFGAMSVSERGVFTKPFWPLLFKVLKIKTASTKAINSEKNSHMVAKEALDALAVVLDKYQNQIAGIIVEPMLQAAGGMNLFASGFFTGIKNLCKQHDILLIADEVATGFYRTGKLFACEHEEVAPDIMCLSKGLTGGFLPLAATLASDKIYQAFLSDKKEEAFLHGHSFTANPLGCAAAIASLELFTKQETKTNIEDLTKTIASEAKAFASLPKVKHVRTFGGIFALDLDSSEIGYLSKASEHIYHYCFDKGLYIRPLGNVIYLMPPLCATIEEIKWALKIIYQAIGEA